MKTFTCRDVGVDCDWKTQGSNEQEILKAVEEHGQTARLPRFHGALEVFLQLFDVVATWKTCSFFDGG
jgi:hypothetical protein